METNMAPLDRILRIISAIGIIILITALPSLGIMIGSLLVVIGGVLVITSLFGFCPLYALLDFSTGR